MRDVRTLRVWQTAHALTLAIDRATARFPAEERFGLTAQMRRAAASVAANIAESCGRCARRDEARLLQIALGSASALPARLLLAGDLALRPEHELGELLAALEDAKRMLGKLVLRTYTQPDWPTSVRRPASRSKPADG